MAQNVKPIPEGYRTITPYLILQDANKAIDFYKRAFGAEELMRFGDHGKIGHAEMKIGDSMFMLADEYPDRGHKSPKAYGGTPVTMHLYVENADSLFARATEAGAEIVQPLQDQFYGDRSGSVRDPFGHFWNIATHKEDVPVEELKRRMAAMPKQN